MSNDVKQKGFWVSGHSTEDVQLLNFIIIVKMFKWIKDINYYPN
jgi:hypothetical protein